MSLSVPDHELPPPVLREVSEGIYAYFQSDGSWWINNTGLLVGRRGAVSIDTCATEQRTKAYLDAIAQVTDRPVRTLINPVGGRSALRGPLRRQAGTQHQRLDRVDP